jgi:plasmid stabilization system protein ParE
MRYAFHPEARREYLDAIAFYQRRQTALAASFTREIEAVIEQICTAPDRWRLFEQDIRRCISRRFPYAVLYSVEAEYVLIIAVMHCSREPDYWKHRISES